MDLSFPDNLVVINGPEDGMTHSIVESRFTVGRSRDCTAVVRLDDGVAEQAAEGVRSGDEYLVRALGSSRIQINGRRVGSVRTRVLRDGDVIRVGSTELVLQCAHSGEGAPGQARAHGAGLSAQLGFRIRGAAQTLLRTLGGFSRGVGFVFKRLFRIRNARMLLFVFVALAALYALVPPARPLFAPIVRLLGAVFAPITEGVSSFVDDVAGQ